MALKITHADNVFYAEGEINQSTLLLFESHLGFLVHAHKTITLNIDKVKQIDASGVQLLLKFYREALLNNSGFYITGYGCKDLYDEFTTRNLA